MDNSPSSSSAIKLIPISSRDLIDLWTDWKRLPLTVCDQMKNQHAAKVLWADLADTSQRLSDDFRTWETIAADTGLSRSAVYRAKNTLKKARLIDERPRSPGSDNTVKIVMNPKDHVPGFGGCKSMFEKDYTLVFPLITYHYGPVVSLVHGWIVRNQWKGEGIKINKSAIARDLHMQRKTVADAVTEMHEEHLLADDEAGYGVTYIVKQEYINELKLEE